MAKTSQKEEILFAARKLFSQRGYFGTTIRDIAKLSGILSGSLYAHISSKEELLFLIVDEAASSFLEAISPIVGSGDPFEAKVHQAFAAHIRVIANHMESAKVFLHEWTALSGEKYQIIKSKRDEYEHHWTHIFAEGAAAELISSEDISMIKLLVLSVANWFYQWYREDGPDSPEVIAEQLAAMLFTGIRNNKK